MRLSYLCPELTSRFQASLFCSASQHPYLMEGSGLLLSLQDNQMKCFKHSVNTIYAALIFYSFSRYTNSPCPPGPRPAGPSIADLIPFCLGIMVFLFDLKSTWPLGGAKGSFWLVWGGAVNHLGSSECGAWYDERREANTTTPSIIEEQAPWDVFSPRGRCAVSADPLSRTEHSLAARGGKVSIEPNKCLTNHFNSS